MKDGAIVCNTGHFNVEIDIPALDGARRHAGARCATYVEEFELKDGRRIYLLGEGRLINLGRRRRPPASVMDMSFANQALGRRVHGEERRSLEKKVYPVPLEIDQEIARLKLASMGVRDRPSDLGSGAVSLLLAGRNLG